MLSLRIYKTFFEGRQRVVNCIGIDVRYFQVIDVELNGKLFPINNIVRYLRDKI